MEPGGRIQVPVALRTWSSTLVLAATLVALAGRPATDGRAVFACVAVVLLAAVDVELGRWAEGQAVAGQRPHKGLSGWVFAAALVGGSSFAVWVVVPVYAYARWRGMRVPLWKWVGSAGIVALAAAAGAAGARAGGAALPGAPLADSPLAVAAVVTGIVLTVAVEAGLFLVCSRVGEASDEAWLRAQLRSPAFYLTEAGVLSGGAVTAALVVASPWMLPFAVPAYALIQRAMLHEPLRARADTDGKTGLLNYDAWRPLAERELGVCRAGALVLLDLDHFKAVNDTYGHLVGDQVLARLSRLFDEVLRGRDVVGRFGGEEFCLLLPDTEAGAVSVVVERLRERVAALTFDPPDLQVTVSAGCCLVTGRTELDAALAAADGALYQAKRDGRDRVCYATPATLVPAMRSSG